MRVIQKMTSMRKHFIILMVAIFVAAFLSGCFFDVPEGYQKNPHSRQDAQNYINEYLGADIVLSDNYEDIIDEYDRKIRRWSAEYQGISFFVATRQDMIFDTTGEFAKNYYHLATDYNLIAAQTIFDANIYDCIRLMDYFEQFRRYGDTVFLHALVHDIESFDSVYMQAKTLNEEIYAAVPSVDLWFFFYVVDGNGKETKVAFYNNDDYFTGKVNFDEDYEKVLAFVEEYFSTTP